MEKPILKWRVYIFFFFNPCPIDSYLYNLKQICLSFCNNPSHNNVKKLKYYL